MGPDDLDKRMSLRYAGVCRVCGTELPARQVAIYERGTKTVRCVECPVGESASAPPSDTSAVVAPVPAAPEPDPPVDPGVAGSSARREYERRKARDEERLRAKWGKLGGIAVALSEEKQSTRAWADGADGEERLGARLDELASEGIVALHDRRIPGTRANIDHIIATPSGVWVVDAKQYRGRVDLRVEGGILRPRVEKLIVNGRNRTPLVDGVLRQLDLVRAVVPGVPVTGALCFVKAGWPLIGGAFVTRGVHVLWPKRLATLLTQSRGTVDVPAVHAALAAHFKAA